jgi:hypothetical protein
MCCCHCLAQWENIILFIRNPGKDQIQDSACISTECTLLCSIKKLKTHKSNVPLNFEFWNVNSFRKYNICSRQYAHEMKNGMWAEEKEMSRTIPKILSQITKWRQSFTERELEKKKLGFASSEWTARYKNHEFELWVVRGNVRRYKWKLQHLNKHS